MCLTITLCQAFKQKCVECTQLTVCKRRPKRTNVHIFPAGALDRARASQIARCVYCVLDTNVAVTFYRCTGQNNLAIVAIRAIHTDIHTARIRHSCCRSRVNRRTIRCSELHTYRFDSCLAVLSMHSCAVAADTVAADAYKRPHGG